MIDKESENQWATLSTVPPSLEGNGGTGILQTANAADGPKDSANSVNVKGKPAAVGLEQQAAVLPEKRTAARQASGERKSRHWSGDRRSRHPSKEKEPALPKSERLYNELMEAVANDNAPRTKSVMRNSFLTADGRLRSLHAAVKRGSNKAAKAILEVEPALVHAADPNSGNTALLVAIEAGTVSTMSLLVDRKARLDAKNRAGETAWDIARRIPHDNKGLIPTLVGLYRQHSKDYHTTPIHEAASAGDGDKIDFLVEAGLDLWDVDRAGYNFIHIAAFNNRTNIILQYLHHRRAPAEITAANTEVNRRCKANGKTALHVAANRGYQESFSALLKCGADVGALDNGKWTVLHDAVVCRNESSSAADIIQQICSDASLLTLALTTDKETALHTAARHGQLGAVQLLLEMSPDSSREALTMQDIDGWTPLHSAIDSCRPEVVQLVIDAMNSSFDAHSLLELPDKSGRSPLQLAQSLPDNNEVVNVLLSYLPQTSVSADR